MHKTSVENRSRFGLHTSRTDIKWWIATFLVFSGALLGEGRAKALWTEGCSQEQQNYITGATIGAYYALQSAVQTYSTDSERVQYYFGVGYNDPQVQYTLANMWGFMNYQDITVVCAQQTDECHPEIVGKYVWAYTLPADVQNHVTRIQVCDWFFDPARSPGEQAFLASPAGLLLHEMAHLGGAYDPANPIDDIGIENVRSLATQTPARSFYNADSYRYYIFDIYNTHDDAQWQNM
jgi:hypothetical protein